MAPGGSDLCLVWPDTTTELLHHLADHRVVVEAGPVPRHGGAGAGTSTYFRDPDGSLLEFIVYADASALRRYLGPSPGEGPPMTLDRLRRSLADRLHHVWRGDPEASGGR